MSQSSILPPAYPTLTAQSTNPLPASPPKLSVVIPSYNNLPALMVLCRHLFQTGQAVGREGRLEVMVQDDCSSDFQITEILMPVFNPARNERNLGFAGNCNAGAKRASGDVILFLNQDTKPRPGWFEPLVAMFDDPSIGIVGPKLVFPGATLDLDTIQSCGGLYDVGKGPYHRYLGYAADDWRVNTKMRVSWTTGAALAVRREAFIQVGGFDIDYRGGYFEDVALCEAVKRLGLEVWYCADSVFEHTVGSTGGIPSHIFKANSMKFHRDWDARITPDTQVRMVNY